MTVTGTNDQPTQHESNTQNTQTNETPISQRGSGQNVLFTTPLARAQAAASQVGTSIRNRLMGGERAPGSGGSPPMFPAPVTRAHTIDVTIPKDRLV